MMKKKKKQQQQPHNRPQVSAKGDKRRAFFVSCGKTSTPTRNATGGASIASIATHLYLSLSF